MNEEMIGQFDFNMIDDGGYDEPEMVEIDDEEVDLEDSDEMGDFPWNKEGDDVDVAFAAKEFESSFSTLPDDYEIAFGDSKVSKKELAEVVSARADITATKAALDTFVGGLVGKEDLINTALVVAKTETERQMDRVNEILDNPDAYNGDLKAVIAAKRELGKRMADLESKGNEAREAVAAQREQATALAIQNTAKAVVGGMDTLRSVATFAQSRGIGHEILMNHISPELVAMIQDAQRYQKAMESNKARVNSAAKGKAPTSTTTAKKTSAGKEANSRKAQILRKIKSGQHVDPADSFLLIQD